MTAPTTTQGEALEARAALPCPICNNHAFVTFNNEVWCATDRCLRLPRSETPGDAIARWNTRAALQPNIDRAVGGLVVESPDDDGKMRGAPPVPPMSEAELQAAIARARNDLRVEYAALSAPQQPVKLDAVREAAEHALTFIENRFSDLSPEKRATVDHLRRALATPSTDTGLDPATVERCAKVAEEFARGDQGTAEGYLESAKTAESTSGRDVDVDTAVGFSKRAGAARQIATLIRALASGDRS